MEVGSSQRSGEARGQLRRCVAVKCPVPTTRAEPDPYRTRILPSTPPLHLATTLIVALLIRLEITVKAQWDEGEPLHTAFLKPTHVRCPCSRVLYPWNFFAPCSQVQSAVLRSAPYSCDDLCLRRKRKKGEAGRKEGNVKLTKAPLDREAYRIRIQVIDI